jgi:quercetin dioxygenase-like cupin family protein
MKTSLVLMLTVCLGLTSSFAHAAAKGANRHQAFTPDEVEWKDGPKSLPPGAMIAVLEGDPAKGGLFTMRLKMPDGYRVAPHWHPAYEHVTVISGTLNLGMGSQFDETKGKALPAGGFAYMAPRMHHFVWASGETIVQVHAMGPWGINYINPQDDPRKKP